MLDGAERRFALPVVIPIVLEAKHESGEDEGDSADELGDEDEVEDADGVKHQQSGDEKPREDEAEPYKFGYPEFEGKQGRNLLYKIVEQILSVASFQTWRSYVSYQRAGNDCYVGLDRLYKDMSIKLSLVERSIRWRWQQIREQGLVIFCEKIVEVVRPDGSTYLQVRHIKDFSPLYERAYAFYQWMRSPAYIPPRYENAAAIRQNKELALWLAEHFDCYRRVLCNQKPGRKPQPSRRADCIKNQLDAAIARDTVERKNFSNTFSNTFAVYNENEISINNYQDKYTNGLASSTDLKNVGAAGAKAIGSTNSKQNLSRNDGVTNTAGEQSSSTPTSETSKQETEMPAAVASMPVQTEKLVEVEKAPRRELPSAWREHIQQASARSPQRFVEQVVPALKLWTNDQATEAYLRNALVRFFKTHGVFDVEAIRRAMLMALVKVYAIPPEEIRKRNAADGSPTWMPAFWKALEKALPQAVFASTEPQEELVEDKHEECGEATAPSHEDVMQETQLDLEQMTAEQLLEIAPDYDIQIDPEEQAKIEQHDEKLTNTLRECIWQVMVDQETWQRYQDELVLATKVLKPLMEPVVAIQTEPCPECSSPISYRADNGQCYCVVCVPSWHWSSKRSAQIKVAVRAVPSMMMIQAGVEQDIPLPAQCQHHCAEPDHEPD
ncbi:hypothetical protein KDH_79580 [Dictyobacter sp. S3.2.2.5]|uniref:DnaA N-terminal domain-containing protein n=1 Tax=Dictyobacter halimunensis TaxID=3026934 RepID=A0ABQ6G3N0_9CHLR|nr:hypothetical protein KDH_79580 [Dictyobacter sp. S3.2.2.5]